MTTLNNQIVKRIKVKATFRGENGSLGYQTGKEYDLTIDQELNNHLIHIERGNGQGKNVYQSFSSFLSNWSNIK